MLVVTMPFQGQVSEDVLNSEIMPVGFIAEMEKSHIFRVFDGLTYVGSVISEEGGKLTFAFINTDVSGKDYVQAFGLKYPAYNPLQVLFGVVYRTPDGLYQLNKLPTKLLEEALEEAKHCANADAYLVQFVFGKWEQDWLAVSAMKKVLPGGELGPDTGSNFLELGNIENDKTM